MYDISQFIPTLYIVVVLGISGFTLAAQLPGVWLLAVGAISFNAWLVYTRRFRRLPRWVTNAITLFGLVILASEFRSGTKILLIGEYLVMLQVVKIWEQSSNRDYAQLLILSLLLMVAASISTASLLFGVLMIGYLVLALYCCLLFHLKVETDRARLAIATPLDRLNPATLRQDQRHLSSSMRRLTGLVALTAIVTAVITFLVFPRGPGEGLLGPTRWKPSETLTGFNDTVNFQNVARITQNNEQVAYVKLLTTDGQSYKAPLPLMLRGVTLDSYSGTGEVSGLTPYQWSRRVGEAEEYEVRSDDPQPVRNASQPLIVQQIQLNPTGTNALFALGAPCALKSNDSLRFRYFPGDQTLQTAEPLTSPIHYQVSSQMTLPNETLDVAALWNRQAASPPSQIDPRIESFARQAAVSGSDVKGPLAAQRTKSLHVSSFDNSIASNIETYLRQNYTYTLDLTDAKRLDRQDPMVGFLFDFKRGHCEYFAGAMTLLCQSLGMQARVVVGFKCDEYSPLGDFYTVRQSQAHAWVEVLGNEGVWHTYDPTSAREAPAAAAPSITKRVTEFMNYLEYTWATSVVAYDRVSRSNVISGMDHQLTRATSQSRDSLSQAKEWLDRNTYSISSGFIGALIGAMILTILTLITFFSLQQIRLRRRARRIGLEALPATMKLRMARQLRFFDELQRLLARNQIYRQQHLTPREFSESLTFLPVEAFDSIQTLTDVFYRVRYGQSELTPIQRRRLDSVLATVEAALARR